MDLLKIAARVASTVAAPEGQEAPPSAPAAQPVSGGRPDVKAVEEALYGTSGAEKDPDMQGSSIWWLVFNEIDMADWTPITDYAAVESKAKDLMKEWAAKGSTFDQNRALRELQENWQEYQENYMPEHVEILKKKGLMK